MGDDFYIMADDANYYSFLVFNYLKSINKPYLIKNDEAIFYFQKNDVLHKIQNNNSHLHWWALLYKHNEGKYKIVALIDFEDEWIFNSKVSDIQKYFLRFCIRLILLI